MGTILLPVIFIIIMLGFFLAFLVITKKQETTLKTVSKDGKIKSNNETNSNKKDTAKEKKEDTIKKEDVFKFMEFDRILDNMIVQKGGSRFTMAIQCKGINYDLMSDVEQLSVEEGFITFLNTLKYPIQLYVQAQNIDLKGAISKYKENVEPLGEEYIGINEKYNKIVSAFDSDEKEVDAVTKERDSVTNVYEYANDIIRYVERMSTNKNLLQRKFYVLISYNTSEISAVDKFTKEEIIEMCSSELITRCRGIISALSSCSVSGKTLDSNEIADLLYSAYNRDDKGLMSVKEALDSGFFRMYSVSEDAFVKKEEALEKYLQDQSKLRALEAIKYVMENDQVKTQASEVLEEEEEISSRATNLVKTAELEPEMEDKVKKKILTDYRNTKEELNAVNEIQKEEIIKRAKEDIKEMDTLRNQAVPSGIELMNKSKQMKADDIKESEALEDSKTDLEEKPLEDQKIEEDIYINKISSETEEDESII